MMKDKKGLIPLLPIIIAAIVLVFILVGFLLFSSSIRWIIIGVGVIVAGIYLAGQAMTGEFSRGKIAFILILLGVGIFLVFGANLLQTTYGGLEIFSIDKIDVEGVGERILITASVGRGAEELRFDFSSSEINNYIEGEGYMVDRGVSGRVYLNKWQHIYPIRKQATEIFYGLSTKNSGDTALFRTGEGNCDINLCKERGYPNTVGAYIHDVAWGRDDCYCIVANELGRNSIFSGEEETRFELLFNVGGETETMTRDKQKISLQNGQFEATFEGLWQDLDDLWGINYDVFWRNSQFEFLIDKNAYTTEYRKERIVIYLKSCAGSNKNEAGWLNCFSILDREIADAVKNKNTEFTSNRLVRSINFRAIDDATGELIVDMEVPDSIPIIKIWLDADWVGLKRLGGQPDITTCIPNVVMKSGDYLTEKIYIKNIGNDEGFFLFSSSCDDDNVRLSGSGTFFNSNEEKYIEVRISGTNTEQPDLRSKCTITIEDENTDKKDTCSFYTTVEYSGVVCMPNEIVCNPDTGDLEICNVEGDEWSLHKDCEKVCEWDATIQKYICGEDRDENGDVECKAAGGRCYLLTCPDDYENVGKYGCGIGKTCCVKTNGEAACIQKALDEKWMGWRWVTETPWYGKIPILKWFAKETHYCRATYILYYILGGVVLVLGILMIILMKPSKTKSRRKRK